MSKSKYRMLGSTGSKKMRSGPVQSDLSRL
ncbi:hypothetical protein DSM3645_29117 [Blastopirellula marina DSM 3645]|uniref:Uncharacterized protein n=1 Tax=Blastopirellula marina DSM 3645 TaxID=314230 RepID=A3ZPP5_9BACT|nr:hypothetical protein DSM3645_29117 [Blastopirellula marina DSM 3645]